MVKNILLISENIKIYSEIISILKKSKHNISTIELQDSYDFQNVAFSNYNLVIVDYNEKIEKHLDRVNYYKLNNGFTKYLVVSDKKREIRNIQEYTGLIKDVLLKNYKEIFESMKILEVEEEIIDLRKKVMLIEDNRREVEIFNKLFNDKLYKLIVVNNTMKAFSEVKKYTVNNQIIDLIIINFNTPGISGHKFIEMIRSDEETKEIPIIIITDRVEKEDVVRVAKYNISGYLSKPLNRGLLIRKVQDILK